VPAEVLSRAGLARGDRVLAHTTTTDGTWLLGTREALVVVPDHSRMPQGEIELAPTQTTRIPWQQVEAADWSRDEERLRVTEVAEFGQVLPVHVFALAEPGRLLPMVRERVTASVLLQRRVVVSGSKGLMVVARRSPRRDGEISWACEYDVGVDPDDPAVAEAAAAGLRAAQEEVGAGGEPI
jgi:hypothetical protein